MYWTDPAVMHYNSSVAQHWTIFSYALYVVCMYFMPLIQLLLPKQINHYYFSGCCQFAVSSKALDCRERPVSEVSLLFYIEWHLKFYLFLPTHFDVFNYTDAHINQSRDITRAAAPGQSVLLPCLIPNANVTDWRYWHDTNRHFDRHHRGRHITRSGVVMPQFTERFQLDSEGLLIRDVQTTCLLYTSPSPRD